MTSTKDNTKPGSWTCYTASKSILFLFWGSTILSLLMTAQLLAQSSETPIVILMFLSSLYLLYRAIHYSRLKVCIDESGLLFLPGNRNIQWSRVDELIFASRAFFFDGIRLPRQTSLQLIIQDEPPVNLPHRFNNMRGLVSRVRRHVEPRLFDLARQQLDKGMKIAFGKSLALTQHNLILVKKGKEVPLDGIDRVDFTPGGIMILDKSGKRLFSDTVEMVPNAFILADLVEYLADHRAIIKPETDTAPQKSRDASAQPQQGTGIRRRSIPATPELYKIGVESEMKRLFGLPYLVVKFSQEYDYDGLDESIELLEGFDEEQEAINHADLAKQEAFQALTAAIASKPGNWRHELAYENSRIKAGNGNPDIKGIYLQAFRAESDSGYDSANYQFEVLLRSDPLAFSPSLFSYYDAEEEWRLFYINKGRALILGDIDDESTTQEESSAPDSTGKTGDAMQHLDQSIPDPVPDAGWEVWYRDTFDREAPPGIDARGQGLAKGLMELWARYLFEQVGAGGKGGFSRFNLRWEETWIDITGSREGATRLRVWVYGTKKQSYKGYVEEGDKRLLEMIASTHANLVLDGQSSEAILAAAESANDREAFETALTALAG